MTHEWKAGDWAMVRVKTVSQNGWSFLATPDVDGNTLQAAPILHTSVLQPLPPLLTPEAQAVLDAVVAFFPDCMVANWDRLTTAVEAYRTTITPPDPVADLIAYCRRIAADDQCWNADDLLKHVAAVEKEMEKPE